MAVGTEVEIEIAGERCSVPGEITLIQALWAAGKRPVHGIGCLGGVCGACPVTYRLGGATAPSTGLACQTLVREGMTVLAFLSDLSQKALYTIPNHRPDQKDLFLSYPETRRCTTCGSCSAVCPQEIDVMSGVKAALSGDFAKVAQRFTACVMCGLCAMVCDVHIRPHRVGLWSRRIAGAFSSDPPHLTNRLAEIDEGRFQGDWERALSEP